MKTDLKLKIHSLERQFDTIFTRFMISVQPTNLWNYLSFKKNCLPQNLDSRFYLSWEDSLWDILRSLKVPKNSTVLIPSFFCMDVVKNMQSHGLKVQFYTLNENLQGSEKEVKDKTEKYHPRLLILFHPVGMTNSLVNKQFINSLPKNLFIIEDSVHRIVNEGALKIYSENHFCLTSLRKVVPLQGSFLYGKRKAVAKLLGPEKKASFYSSMVIFLWFLMQIFLHLQFLIPKSGLIAEKLMKIGYDLIGNNENPGPCPKIFAWLYSHINIEKLEKIKIEQVKIYFAALKGNKNITIPKIDYKDFGRLRGFPIILSKQKGAEAIRSLRRKNIFVRPELVGCPWTNNRTIIYLPLGPNVSTKDCATISLECKCISKAQPKLLTNCHTINDRAGLTWSGIL